MNLLAAMEATWPAASVRRAGPFAVREGRGAGHRVSAATAVDDWTEADVPTAEAAMAALGQVPLFMVREGEDALDSALAGRGYAQVAPVLLYSAPVAALVDPGLEAMSGFAHWPPLSIAREIWAEGQIGPARLGVMERASAPKAALLARTGDRPAGVAFAAVSGAVAMVHAIHVDPRLRRQGTGQALMRVAAGWAQAQGASVLALAVERKNAPARALYDGLGMTVAGQYHYREAAA